MAHQLFDVIRVIAQEARLTPAYVPPTEVNVVGATFTDGLLLRVLISNSDAIAHHAQLVDSGFATSGIVTSALVPAGAGHGATPPVDLVAVAFPTNNVGFPVPSSDSFAITILEAITAGAIDVYTQIGYF